VKPAAKKKPETAEKKPEAAAPVEAAPAKAAPVEATAPALAQKDTKEDDGAKVEVEKERIPS